jgi:hypothetical protein
MTGKPAGIRCPASCCESLSLSHEHKHLILKVKVDFRHGAVGKIVLLGIQDVPVAVVVGDDCRAIGALLKLDRHKLFHAHLGLQLDDGEDIRHHPAAAALFDEVDAIGILRVATEHRDAIILLRAAEVAKVRVGEGLGCVHASTVWFGLASQAPALEVSSTSYHDKIFSQYFYFLLDNQKLSLE